MMMPTQTRRTVPCYDSKLHHSGIAMSAYAPMTVRHGAVPPSGNWVSSVLTLSKSSFGSEIPVGGTCVTVWIDDTFEGILNVKNRRWTRLWWVTCSPLCTRSCMRGVFSRESRCTVFSVQDVHWLEPDSESTAHRAAFENSAACYWATGINRSCAVSPFAPPSRSWS